MMLESLRLIDFKSFVDETLAFSPVTYIVGSNDAGKSNVLDALRFLRALPFDGLDAPFRERASGGFEASELIRGGAREVSRCGTDGFSIHSQWSFSEGEKGRSRLGHEIRCQVRPTVRLLGERLVDARGREIARSSPLAGEERESTGESILHIGTCPAEAERLSISLGLLRCVDVQPERMRRSSSRGLDSSWHDESNWLSEWYRIAHHRRPGARAWFETFVEWTIEASGSMLQGLELVEDEQGVSMVLVERDGRRVSVRSASDGLLRCMEIFALLMTAKPGSLVCLDAPAAGLHPVRAKLLVELFQGAYDNRGIQVVATVHDASLLRWLDDEHLGRVVWLARTPEHPGTVARRLGDLSGFFDAVRALGLEEMLVTQWLEAAL